MRARTAVGVVLNCPRTLVKYSKSLEWDAKVVNLCEHTLLLQYQRRFSGVKLNNRPACVRII